MEILILANKSMKDNFITLENQRHIENKGIVDRKLRIIKISNIYIKLSSIYI